MDDVFQKLREMLWSDGAMVHYQWRKDFRIYPLGDLSADVGVFSPQFLDPVCRERQTGRWAFMVGPGIPIAFIQHSAKTAAPFY